MITPPYVGQKAVEVITGDRYDMIVTRVISPKKIELAQGDSLSGRLGSAEVYTLRNDDYGTTSWHRKGARVRGISTYLC